MTASIPTHRLFVHVRRLVSQGYKVSGGVLGLGLAIKCSSNEFKTIYVLHAVRTDGRRMIAQIGG